MSPEAGGDVEVPQGPPVPLLLHLLGEVEVMPNPLMSLLSLLGEEEVMPNPLMEHLGEVEVTPVPLPLLGQVQETSVYGSNILNGQNQEQLLGHIQLPTELISLDTKHLAMEQAGEQILLEELENS